MKVQNKIAFTLPFVVSLLFTGCATKSVKPKVIVKRIVINEVNKKDTTYPVLKENNPTQRAIVDMGVALKTKITSYKDNSGNLIASHDVFFWARRPDFITTNVLPRKRIKRLYSGLKIDLNKKGLVNLNEAVSKEAVKSQKISIYDKKIDSFINNNKK